MYCRDCGSEVPDGSRFCPSCGSAQDARAAREGCGKSELAAMVLSFLVPGAGLFYLGDRKLALCMFLPSLVLLIILIMLDGYAGSHGFGINVDDASGFLVLGAMFAIWLYSNYRARKLWEELSGDRPLL